MRRRIPVVTDKLSDKDKRIMIEFSKSLLAGVGAVPWTVEREEFAIHHRKALSAEEVSRLPESWCTRPAVDAGGHGEILEEDLGHQR